MFWWSKVSGNKPKGWTKGWLLGIKKETQIGLFFCFCGERGLWTFSLVSLFINTLYPLQINCYDLAPSFRTSFWLPLSLVWYTIISYSKVRNILLLSKELLVYYQRHKIFCNCIKWEISLYCLLHCAWCDLALRQGISKVYLLKNTLY